MTQNRLRFHAISIIANYSIEYQCVLENARNTKNDHAHRQKTIKLLLGATVGILMAKPPAQWSQEVFAPRELGSILVRLCATESTSQGGVLMGIPRYWFSKMNHNYPRSQRFGVIDFPSTIISQVLKDSKNRFPRCAIIIQDLKDFKIWSSEMY